MFHTRLRDAFVHLGIAIALAHASKQIADIYGVTVNLHMPLPPYPGAIVVPQTPRLYLA